MRIPVRNIGTSALLHELLTCIHLRICSILTHAIQLGVRTPVLATTSRDCAGPTGLRCEKAAILAPAVVVLLHALDDAGAFILLLGRLLLLMPTILMPTILMPITLLLLMPAGLVLLLSPFRALLVFFDLAGTKGSGDGMRPKGQQCELDRSSAEWLSRADRCM